MKLVMLVLLVSCGGQTQLPKGPPPEYEDEPVVGSAEGGTTQVPVVVDAGVE